MSKPPFFPKRDGGLEKGSCGALSYVIAAVDGELLEEGTDILKIRTGFHLTFLSQD